MISEEYFLVAIIVTGEVDNRVRGRVRGPVTGRRSHEIRLTEIARGIEDLLCIRLDKLREKGKDAVVMEGRSMDTKGRR